MRIMTPSTFSRLWHAGQALLLAFGLSGGAAAESLTTGIDRCDNKGVAVAPAAARYLPASGRLELPLVFAPGYGWYRAALQTLPGTELRFSLVDLVPTCD